MRSEDITVGDILYYFKITEPAGAPKELYLYKIKVEGPPILSPMNQFLVPATLLKYYATPPSESSGRKREFPLLFCYRIADMSSNQKRKWIRDCFSLTD